MNLCLIVAFDSKYGISKNGMIPWNCAKDRKFFSDTTKNHICIMGKNTWKSLPDHARGLVNRINIVISSTMTIDELINDNKTGATVYLVENLDAALGLCHPDKKVFICGGSKLYQEALNKLTFKYIYITKINYDYECDNFFPYEQCLLQTIKLSHGTTRLDEFNDIKISFNEYY